MNREPDLRYLDADAVSCAAGNLADFDVRTEDAQVLGRVDGVLISPSTRRLAYLVMRSPGRFLHRRYLLPFESGAVVRGADRTLVVPAKRGEVELEPFTPRSVPPFSDDDLLETLFRDR